MFVELCGFDLPLCRVLGCLTFQSKHKNKQPGQRGLGSDGWYRHISSMPNCVCVVVFSTLWGPNACRPLTLWVQTVDLLVSYMMHIWKSSLIMLTQLHWVYLVLICFKVAQMKWTRIHKKFQRGSKWSQIKPFQVFSCIFESSFVNSNDHNNPSCESSKGQDLQHVGPAS